MSELPKNFTHWAPNHQDFFGNAFGLSWTSRLYRNDYAGLSHVRGGPNSNHWGHPGATPRASFFTAYRLFDRDPVLFSGGRMALVWRNGGPKCGLNKAAEAEDAETEATSDAINTGLLRGSGQQQHAVSPRQQQRQQQQRQQAPPPGAEAEAGAGAVQSMVWFYTYDGRS